MGKQWPEFHGHSKWKDVLFWCALGLLFFTALAFWLATAV